MFHVDSLSSLDTNDRPVHRLKYSNTAATGSKQKPMLIKALESTSVCDYEQLGSFLSGGQTFRGKLGAYECSELDVLSFIGSGKEGLVLKCRRPRSNSFFVLKMVCIRRSERRKADGQQFFQNREHTNQAFWPLKYEARYYAFCAARRSYFSKSTHTLPPLPRLPYTKWVVLNKEQGDQELFNAVSQDMAAAQLEAEEGEDIFPLLEKMCASGWVAFEMRGLQQMLQQILTNRELERLERFSGPVVIGIVKPFFEDEASSETRLKRQVQTMLLMREFGWRLRDLQDRNWVDGYLVDGGDVDTHPLHLRYLERTWVAAFFTLMKRQREVGQSTCIKDES
jgi:hypothetical protein